MQADVQLALRVNIVLLILPVRRQLAHVEIIVLQELLLLLLAERENILLQVKADVQLAHAEIIVLIR